MVYRISLENLETLARMPHCRQEAWGKDERITEKYQEKNFLYVLTQGLIYLCAENEHYQRGILRYYQPGEVFQPGMLPEIEHYVRYYIAKYPSQGMAFPEGALEQLGLESPWQAQAREQMAYDTLLQQRGVRQRLIGYLRREARLQGTQAITLPLPLADLADYLALDRAAMTRELSRMKKEGLVQGERRTLTLAEALR